MWTEKKSIFFFYKIIGNVDIMNISEFHMKLIYFPLSVLSSTFKNKSPSEAYVERQRWEDNTQAEWKERFSMKSVTAAVRSCACSKFWCSEDLCAASKFRAFSSIVWAVHSSRSASVSMSPKRWHFNWQIKLYTTLCESLAIYSLMLVSTLGWVSSVFTWSKVEIFFTKITDPNLLSSFSVWRATAWWGAVWYEAVSYLDDTQKENSLLLPFVMEHDCKMKHSYIQPQTKLSPTELHC